LFPSSSLLFINLSPLLVFHPPHTLISLSQSLSFSPLFRTAHPAQKFPLLLFFLHPAPYYLRWEEEKENEKRRSKKRSRKAEEKREGHSNNFFFIQLPFFFFFFFLLFLLLLSLPRPPICTPSHMAPFFPFFFFFFFHLFSFLPPLSSIASSLILSLPLLYARPARPAPSSFFFFFSSSSFYLLLSLPLSDPLSISPLILLFLLYPGN
jgi:hypothetical protein